MSTRTSYILVALFSLTFVSACAQKPVKAELAFDPNWADQVEGEHNHEVLFCYEDLLKTKPKMQGRFSIGVDTDAAGAVKSAKVLESLDPKFDSCVLAKAKSWQYPWFKKAMKGLKDDYHLTLVNNQPMSEFSRPYVLGDDVKETISNHLTEVHRCYDSRRRSLRHLAGKLTLQWTLDSTGKASDVGVLEPLDTVLDSCVAKLVEKWKFPALPAGETEKVSYPFTFAYK